MKERLSSRMLDKSIGELLPCDCGLHFFRRFNEAWFDPSSYELEPLEPLWGLMDNEGSVICEPAWSDVQPFREGLAAVCLDGLWGYIGEEGTLKIPAVLQDAQPFSQGRAAVLTDDGWAYITPEGQLCRFTDTSSSMYDRVLCHFAKAQPFRCGYALVADGLDHCAFVDLDGGWHKVSAGSKVSDMFETPEGPCYTVTLTGSPSSTFSIHKPDGTCLHSVIRDEIPATWRGYAVFKAKKLLRGQLCGIITLHDGARELSARYKRIELLQDGRSCCFAAWDDQHFTLLDHKLQTCLCVDNPSVYKSASYSRGVVCMEYEDGKKSLFHLGQKRTIAFNVDDAAPFCRGMAWVCKSKGWYLVDSKGRRVSGTFSGVDHPDATDRYATAWFFGATMLLDRHTLTPWHADENAPVLQSLADFAGGLLQAQGEWEAPNGEDWLLSPVLTGPGTQMIRALADDYAACLTKERGRVLTVPEIKMDDGVHTLISVDEIHPGVPPCQFSIRNDKTITAQVILDLCQTEDSWRIQLRCSEGFRCADLGQRAEIRSAQLEIPSPMPFFHGCDLGEGARVETLDEHGCDVRLRTGSRRPSAGMDGMMAQYAAALEACGMDMRREGDRWCFDSPLAAPFHLDDTECAAAFWLETSAEGEVCWRVCCSRDIRMHAPVHQPSLCWPFEMPDGFTADAGRDIWQRTERILLDGRMPVASYQEWIGAYFEALGAERIREFEGASHYYYVCDDNPSANTLRAPNGEPCALILRETEGSGHIRLKAALSSCFHIPGDLQS